MRSSFFSHAILVAIIGALSLTTACKKGDKGKSGAGAAPPPLGAGGEIPTGERPPIGGSQDRSTFAAETVYFDYDSAKIRPSEVSKIEAIATALKGNNKNLIIEGNTDERGTAEYNRALGERRAEAAREELIRLGIAASRLTTISYGKDRPADTGHDDAAMAKNRRDEFVVAGQ